MGLGQAGAILAAGSVFAARRFDHAAPLRRGHRPAMPAVADIPQVVDMRETDDLTVHATVPIDFFQFRQLDRVGALT